MEDYDNLLVFFLGTLNGLFLALILTLLKGFLGPKSEFSYSNKTKAYREEFHVFTLIEKLKEKSSHIYHQKVPCLFQNCKEIIAIKDVDKHMEQCHKMLKIGNLLSVLCLLSPILLDFTVREENVEVFYFILL